MVAMRLFVILVLPILVVKVLYACFLGYHRLNEVLHVKRLKANLRSINKVCGNNFVVRFYKYDILDESRKYVLIGFKT